MWLLLFVSAAVWAQVDAPVSSSSADATFVPGSQSRADRGDRSYRSRVAQTPLYDWWRHPGVSVSAGINGVGVDVAEAVRQGINVRVGAEFLHYTGQFTEENAQVNVDVRLGGVHTAVDVYPFQRSSFHFSPQLRFGILTRGRGTVLIPPGQLVNFSGVDYTSDPNDPLRGYANVDTRKFAPGLSVGFGNLVPRERYKHWTFPVDLGFYYIGQPHLAIDFVGKSYSVTPGQPVTYDDVTVNPDFQRDLARFRQKQEHNASYASFFPILSFGVGYRF